MNYFYSDSEIGFSLLELLFVVAIIGVLATVAYPAYIDVILKSHRVDAHAGLIKMQLEQEHFRLVNSGYAENTGSEIHDVKPALTRYYLVKITSANQVHYLLTASAIGVQVADEECKEMTLSSTGDKLPVLCWK